MSTLDLATHPRWGEYIEAAQRWTSAKDAERYWRERADEAQRELLLCVDEANESAPEPVTRLTLGGQSVGTVVEFTAGRFNTKKFREEYPDLYSAFLVPSNARFLRRS